MANPLINSGDAVLVVYDKDYKSMLPCYYVEKSVEVKECA